MKNNLNPNDSSLFEGIRAIEKHKIVDNSMKVVSKKTSYSFKEKYFQVEPEGRINRKQFIARWFLIFIIGMIV